MSAIALANRYGLTYVHTPFRGMQDAEGPEATDIYKPDEAWARHLGAYFQPGTWRDRCRGLHVAARRDRRLHGGSEMVVVPVSALRRLLQHDRRPHAGRLSRGDSAAAGEILSRARRRGPGRTWSRCARICDAGSTCTRDNPETAYRYVDNDVMAKSISMTQSVLRELGLASRVRLFSQGDEKDFASLRDLGFELCLNTKAIPTFRAFVEADVFIMTKSSFSYAAAILNDGVKLYDRFARAPMSHWIVRESDGGFDREQLRARLVALRAA